MARNATADPTTAPTDGTATEGATPTRTRPDRSYIVMPVPPEFKSRLEAEAKDANVPVGPYTRNLLARFLGVELPPQVVTARRSQYANDDERKAAQKARNKSRSSTMRDLMKLYREAVSSGKPPEEAAALASDGLANLLKNGPAPAAETSAETPAADLVEASA